jgi:hypothetical protein
MRKLILPGPLVTLVLPTAPSGGSRQQERRER